jgi:hypothetical protein
LEDWFDDEEFYTEGSVICIACVYEGKQAKKEAAQARGYRTPEKERERQRLKYNKNKQKYKDRMRLWYAKNGTAHNARRKARRSAGYVEEGE